MRKELSGRALPCQGKDQEFNPLFRSVLSPYVIDQILYTECRALRFKGPTKAVNAGRSLRFQAWIDGGLHQEHSLSCCQRQAGCSTCIAPLSE